MRLTVLGAGPAYSDREGASGACYLVSEGTTNLLLDLGHGSFQRIFGATLPTDLDAVIVSHLHPDHFIDLVPLRHYLRYYLDPPRRMRVLGPRDLATRLDALHADPAFTSGALDTEPIGREVHRIGELEAVASQVAHTDDSYGVRVWASGTAGPGLVYSGDCGRADDLRPLIRPGDTLLSEVSFGPGPVPPGVLHLDGPAVGGLAASTGVGRVLLTHLQMGFDPDDTLASVKAAYDGPVEFVWPGTRVEL
ncbi:MAG TPA: MBL fold metallo-hydrolase [Candidatus Limnocylindrales bacterium]